MSKELQINRELQTVAGRQVLVLQFVGYIDSANYHTFEEATFLPLAEGHCNLLLDFSGVEYVNSTTYGLLLGAARKARAAGGNLVVAGLAPRVERGFSKLGLQGFIQSFPTTPEALESFAPVEDGMEDERGG